MLVTMGLCAAATGIVAACDAEERQCCSEALER
jgi:hypothetical protein